MRCKRENDQTSQFIRPFDSSSESTILLIFSSYHYSTSPQNTTQVSPSYLGKERVRRIPENTIQNSQSDSHMTWAVTNDGFHWTTLTQHSFCEWFSSQCLLILFGAVAEVVVVANECEYLRLSWVGGWIVGWRFGGTAVLIGYDGRFRLLGGEYVCPVYTRTGIRVPHLIRLIGFTVVLVNNVCMYAEKDVIVL